jgi:hypothetical protein
MRYALHQERFAAGEKKYYMAIDLHNNERTICSTDVLDNGKERGISNEMVCCNNFYALSISGM